MEMEKLLTVEDLMSVLRISRPTVYRLLKAGKLQPVRIGKRTLFDPHDIRAFIDGSKADTGTQKPPRKQRAKSAEGSRKQGTKSAKPRRKEGAQPKPEKAEKVKTGSDEDFDRQGRLL